MAAVYIQLNYAFILMSIPRYFNYMHYIADNVNGALLRCELEIYLDLTIRYAKSKHYSCHMKKISRRDNFVILVNIS